MSTKIRVTKEFDFEAAHALDGYEGKCKDIHGHSYHLKVTFLGTPNRNEQQSTCGMVIDFGDLKKIVATNILPLFDHRLILRNDSRFQGLEKNNERIRYVNYQPTCENMLIEIVEIINDNLEDNMILLEVELRETSSSYATWTAIDNK